MTRRNLSLLAGLVVLSSFVGGAVAQQTAGLLNQALQHRDKGDYSSAITDFQQAVRLDPENASLWNYLCSTQIMAAQYKEAIKSLKDVKIVSQTTGDPAELYRHAATIQATYRAFISSQPVDGVEVNVSQSISHRSSAAFDA